MAVGTLFSRGTGFLRTLVLVYAIGTSFLGNAYNNANTLPNTVYYLMLGGIFTSVVVPLLVRAARRDPDRGEAYTQRMFTLGAVALLGVTVVAMLLADPLVTLYAPTIHGPAGSHLAACEPGAEVGDAEWAGLAGPPGGHERVDRNEDEATGDR